MRGPLRPVAKQSRSGDRRRIKVEYIGNKDVIFHGKSDQIITLIDVAYVPDLRFNLYSLHAVQRTHLIVSGASGTHFFFSFFFFFISLIVDGPHHYHPACGHKGSSHLSPVPALHFFYRDASSALLQLVNQWLNFTYSRSHAFRYERKNTIPTLVRIELTTSVLADVQLTY